MVLAHRRDVESAAELTALLTRCLLVRQWVGSGADDGACSACLLARRKVGSEADGGLALWVDDKSPAGLMPVLACWRDFESASGLTAVLAHRRSIELAAELTAGLLTTCWCDNELVVGRMAVLAFHTCCLDEETAARRMGVLARWVDKESAVRQNDGACSSA